MLSFRAPILSGRLSEKFHKRKKKQKKQQLRKAIVSCFYIFLKSQGCPVPINDKLLSTAQDLTHPLYHNVHSVCIHQFLISVSFFMFLTSSKEAYPLWLCI